MVVVADTSPIRYLVLIGFIHLLPELFGQVLVPPAVWHELSNPSTPELVRQFMTSAPEWLRFQALEYEPRQSLALLDVGEREALELALQLKAKLVLIDEAEGRSAAINARLAVRGTVGILVEAAIAGKLEIANALDKLAATNFYLTPTLRTFAIAAAKTKGTL